MNITSSRLEFKDTSAAVIHYIDLVGNASFSGGAIIGNAATDETSIYDDDPNFPNLASAAPGAYVCYNSSTKNISYSTVVCTGGAVSPFLLSEDGIPMSEVLANQWKIEANSVNRIDGQDPLKSTKFLLASFKRTEDKGKETDHLDSISLNLRCQTDNHREILKNYPVIKTSYIGEKYDETLIDSISKKDGNYLVSHWGDVLYVEFVKPNKDDLNGCQNYQFTFDAYGYYDWELPEFDEAQINNFWKEYEPFKIKAVNSFKLVF